MKLENLKNEAPVMPEAMRKMVEQQVAAQIENNMKNDAIQYKKKKISWKKITVAVVAATMVVGTTVFAGVQYYQLQMEKEGQYGLRAGVTASGEEMDKTHGIGEVFALPVNADIGDETGVASDAVSVCVTDVQVADDNSLLNDAYMDDDLKAAFSADGKLAANEISYMKSGDGVDSLDEKLSTKTVNQELVYATVEYTNTGDQELQNVLVFGSFVGITQQDDGYVFYDRAAAKGADYAAYSSIGRLGEMNYYDVRGNEGKNYIDSLQPGETVTVHLAKIVNEDELDKMYLSLDSSGGAYEFSEEALETGYVDIAQ